MDADGRLGEDHGAGCPQPSKQHAPIMLTTDLALRLDPIYGPISKRFHENPDQFADAFAKAWFKLTHRDMGPVSRYLGPLVPAEPQLFQDPIPKVDHELIGEQDVAALKAKVLESGLTVSQLVATAWASAASFRGTDKRGGANGARIRLEPQNELGGQQPEPSWQACCQTLEGIQQEFNSAQSGGKKVSLADLIVLGGCAGVEQAAKNAGHDVTVPFAPGRTDALQEQTDVESFAVLEPIADGFRNYVRAGRDDAGGGPARGSGRDVDADRSRADGAHRRFAGPENLGRSEHGVFTNRAGTLTNDFFVNLLDMSTEWTASASSKDVFEGHDRATGAAKWTGTAVDLVFGSNSQLRAVAEVYASDDSSEKFVSDFVAAWDKVMNLDRFDLA